jgi:hypothetical protein
VDVGEAAHFEGAVISGPWNAVWVPQDASTHTATQSDIHGHRLQPKRVKRSFNMGNTEETLPLDSCVYHTDGMFVGSKYNVSAPFVALHLFLGEIRVLRGHCVQQSFGVNERE